MTHIDGPARDDLVLAVSAEQQAIVDGIEDLSDAEKVAALDALEQLGSGEFLGSVRPVLLSVLVNAGLAQGRDGLWRDAMVPLDAEHPEHGYVYTPESVR